MEKDEKSEVRRRSRQQANAERKCIVYKVVKLSGSLAGVGNDTERQRQYEETTHTKTIGHE